MSDSDVIEAWIDRYLKAWNTNDPADVGDLFTEEASYRTDPWAKPWSGRQAIVDGWIARADDPGDTTFEWHTVVVQEDLAVIEGTTRYRAEGLVFSNLWLLRLDPAGDCTSFTEYWMEHPRD